jgi:hypothetical protein
MVFEHVMVCWQCICDKLGSTRQLCCAVYSYHMAGYGVPQPGVYDTQPRRAFVFLRQLCGVV